MLRQAEKLIGIELTDAQEAMALQNVSTNLDRYETLTKDRGSARYRTGNLVSSGAARPQIQRQTGKVQIE